MQPETSIDIKVIIAIITSVASVIVAIISLITAILINNKSARQSKKIEELKYSLEKRTKKMQIDLDERSRRLESLGNIITAIQRLKDRMQMLLSAYDDSIDSESAVELISEARVQMFNCYENNLIRLSKEENKIAHKAKDISHDVETTVRKNLNEYEWVSCLSHEAKEEIQKYRYELSEKQNRLRDFKMDLLSDIRHESEKNY